MAIYLIKMEILSITQKITIALIAIPGTVLGIAFILLKQNKGWQLIKAGFFLALFGLIAKVATGVKFYDVLLLIDTTGIGRAYPSGLIFLLTGLIVSLWQVITYFIFKRY